LPRRDPRLLLTGLLAAAWFTLPLGFSVLLFAYLGEVSEWLRGHGAAGATVGAAAFAVAAGTGILPTYAQAVLMGWVFGTATGAGVSVAGYVGGAVIGWSFSRLVAGDAVRRAIDGHPRWGVVRSALVDASPLRTMGLVALLRFPPNSPFAFTNLVLAATGVRFVPMIAGSVVGMLPRTVFACWIGAQGAATGATDLADLMRKQGPTAVVVGVVLLVVALFVMQQVGNRALRTAGLR
jgi:uncharacterized membrane protein YdjX (TVP38/TMEM64 family)